MGLFDIFTNKNAQDAANIQAAGARQAYGDLGAQFGAGRDALTSNYTAALQPFLQQQQTGTTGTNALLETLGLSGDPTKVQATLAATPGYQFALNQGNENVLRNQAATGQLNSGKTNLDLQRFGEGLADQTYQSRVANLMPFLDVAGKGAAGGAGVLTGLGSGLNQSFMGQGQAAYGADTSAANAQANADLAKNAASGNIWNLIMGGAKAVAGLPFGSMGFGGAGKGIG